MYNSWTFTIILTQTNDYQHIDIQINDYQHIALYYFIINI
nr:MAG TPA: hypothetical protein [Crassvirales sp.]